MLGVAWWPLQLVDGSLRGAVQRSVHAIIQQGKIHQFRQTGVCTFLQEAADDVARRLALMQSAFPEEANVYVCVCNCTCVRRLCAINPVGPTVRPDYPTQHTKH